MFVEKVLGVKLAISDHRAPNVTESELTGFEQDQSGRYVKRKTWNRWCCIWEMQMLDLSPVFEALEKSMIPIKIFRPTHVNRRKGLLEEGYQLLEKGGYIDLTCGISEDFCPGGCILEAKKRESRQSILPSAPHGHEAGQNTEKTEPCWKSVFPQ